MSVNLNTRSATLDLFMEAVILGRAFERSTTTTDDLEARMNAVLLRLEASRGISKGPLFFDSYDHYEVSLLLEAERYCTIEGECSSDDREILGLILEEYAKFYACFLGFWKLPKLRAIFQEMQLSEWLYQESHPEAFHGFIDQYFGLIDTALQVGDVVTEQEIERLREIATLFNVPFTSRIEKRIWGGMQEDELMH